MTFSKKFCFIATTLLCLTSGVQASTLAQLTSLNQKMNDTKVIARHAKPGIACYDRFYREKSGQIDLLCSSAIRIYQRAQDEALQAALAYYREKGEVRQASAIETTLDRFQQYFRQQENRLQGVAIVNQRHIDRLHTNAEQARMKVPDLSSMDQRCYQKFIKGAPQLLSYNCSEQLRDYTRLQLQYLQAEIAYQTELHATNRVHRLRLEQARLEHLISIRQHSLMSAEAAIQPCAAAMRQTVRQRCAKLPSSSYYDCLEAACYQHKEITRTRLSSETSSLHWL